jgi:hypothetical protein
MIQFILKMLYKLPKAYLFIHGGPALLREWGPDRPYYMGSFRDFVYWLNSFGSNKWIYSDYSSGWEFIEMHQGFFKALITWSRYQYCIVDKGNKNFDSKTYNHEANLRIEEYDPAKDQITYYNPLSHMAQ